MAITKKDVEIDVDLTNYIEDLERRYQATKLMAHLEEAQKSPRISLEELNRRWEKRFSESKNS